MTTVLWDMSPCNLVDSYHFFGRAYCLYLQGERVSWVSAHASNIVLKILFCLLLQVEPTQLGPVDGLEIVTRSVDWAQLSRSHLKTEIQSCLRNLVCFKWNRTKDNVQKHNNNIVFAWLTLWSWRWRKLFLQYISRVHDVTYQYYSLWLIGTECGPQVTSVC
jgi:hypothetical protein